MAYRLAIRLQATMRPAEVRTENRMPDMQMPDFQSEINRAKSIAASRGFGRLTFGWKERDQSRPFGARSGTVTVTSAAPSAFRVYERGRAIPWLTEFDRDITAGVFGTTAE